jgi:hypothetical protein
MAIVRDALPGAGNHDDVHTTQQNDLGAVRTFSNGNTYIYLKGVTSCADGSVVVYQPGVWTAVLIATTVKGQVAIAQGAVDASTKYGWFLIVGSDTITVRTAVTSNTALFAGGVSGYVDVAAVKGDQVFGMHCRNAAGGDGGSAQIQIDRATVGFSNESTG